VEQARDRASAVSGSGSSGRKRSSRLSAWAVGESKSRQNPVLVESRVDRETDASMGVLIDKMLKRDSVIDIPAGAPVNKADEVR